MMEGLEQIVECRRVLKWSYAYGYYLSTSTKSKKSSKEELFDYLQGEAETFLERLHHCVEKEYLKAENPSDDFRGFMEKLVGLKNATSKYFQNLVVALESGLSEVTVRKRKRKKLDKGGIQRRRSYKIAKRRRDRENA